MESPFMKTPVELWEALEGKSRDNPLVRNVLMCKRAHNLTPEHAALGLALALLDQNEELGKHVLEFYRNAPGPNPEILRHYFELEFQPKNP